MVEVIEREVQERDVDALAVKVFLKAIDIVGGPKKLFEYRNLTWLPSLMEASYVVVLSEEKMKTANEIAEELGISSATVRNILGADKEKVKERLVETFTQEGEEEDSSTKVHIAGGLAKLAYERVKEGDENVAFLLDFFESYKQFLTVTWPIEVLIRIKGVDFPVSKEELASRLQGVEVKGHKIEEVLERLEYPVNSPASLLQQIAANVE